MKRLLISIVVFIVVLVSSTTASADFFSDVIVTSPDGIWTDSRAYATLQAAITAVGSNEREIVVAKEEVCTTLTIPSNVHLRFTREGSITNSGLLRVQTKNISAGDYQIFTGAGNVTFANGSIVRSPWFADLPTAFNQTVGEYLTLVIASGWSGHVDSNCAVGNDVTLKWENPTDRIVIDAGFTLSNIKNIEAGNYQIFAGNGDLDFLDGSELKLNWFPRLRSALTWIENEEATVTVNEDSTVSFTQASAANEKIKVLPGGRLNLDAGVTLTINGPFEAGLYQVFSGAGNAVSGVARRVHPEWWHATGEWGVAINDAIAAIRAVGGIVEFSTDMTITTPINATNTNSGIVFSGMGGSPSYGPRITGELATVLFDCTGSKGLIFENFTIMGDSVVIPQVGFLLARNSVLGGAGDHTFRNVRADYSSYFSVAVIYSYGSEENKYYSCNFANNVAGAAVFYSTRYNSATMASVYQTIAAGSQSNSVTNIFGTDMLSMGGLLSDVIYIDGTDDFHVYGGFWYCGSATQDGRSYVYVDTTNGASNYMSFTGIRGEVGTHEPDYGFYFGDTVRSPYAITITNNRLSVAAGGFLIYAHNNATLYGLYVDNTPGDISVYLIRDSTVRGYSVPYTLRAGGTQTRCLIDTASPTITGANALGVTIDRTDASIASVYGLVHDRGNVAAYDFAVGDFTTDNTWRDLDLSAIVPANARMVFLAAVIADNLIAQVISLRRNGNANEVTMSTLVTQVANQENSGDMVVACDSGRIIEYKASNTAWTTINLVVTGWSK